MLNLPRHRLRASSCPDLYRDSITTIAGTQRGVRLFTLLRQQTNPTYQNSEIADRVVARTRLVCATARTEKTPF